MRRAVAAILFACCAAVPAAAQQLSPAGTGGMAALDHALRELRRNARVLLIAAHPDDEDTELLTLLSRGLGVDAAYLSLSRGEGGQNLIGPDLGEVLGLIRSGELLAARSVDGARQYFTRAFDFGFSRSIEETQRFWPREEILRDAMRVMRSFGPHVLVSTWSGTPRDGHGQHQMAGAVAREVFELTRDSSWGPRKLYRVTRIDTTGTTLVIPTGVLDDVSGRSFHQVAMASRSLHRSQDMGQLQRIGPAATRLSLVADATGRAPGGTRGAAAALASGNGGGDWGAAAELFAGVDISLPGGLARYAALLDSAHSMLTPRGVGRVLPLLLSALSELRRAAPPEFRAAKEPVLEEAIAAAAEVVADATTDDGRLVRGQNVEVRVTVWNAGRSNVRVTDVTLDSPRGWTVTPRGSSLAPDGGQGFFSVGRLPVHAFGVTVAADAAISEPYFLALPRGPGLYDWSTVPDSLRGEPFDPPLLRARIAVEVEGVGITLVREVSHRYSDQALGEIRKPLIVVPRVGVAAAPAVLVWPTSRVSRRTVTVELVHGAPGRSSGELRLEVPAGWPSVRPQSFVLDGEDTRRSFTFEVTSPARLRSGEYELRAVALVDGERFEAASVTVDHPHIRPVTYRTSAVVRVAAADIALPAARRIGYVRGASDLVPEALAAVGLDVSVLTAGDLERGDLASYDAIVVGSRAYETEPALVASNGRLLDWVRGGGRLIVQYQQYPFVRGGFAPYPLDIARPHDRVTDEGAPVNVLEPGHPVFRAPNRIGPADWEGWVQERGLYFAREWDGAYAPLLETGDEGQRLRGGLLVARVGRGTYVYTGLSFFRQLPAGVPGAFRLFANLLSLGAPR